jgi:ABC-type antimicrobial peptide transport system permease subunit
MDNNDWGDSIEQILQNIRSNCVILSKLHKQRYFLLKSRLVWYRIPLIILNGFNSIISIGLQPYATQGIISITTSLISLTCGIVGSVELFFGIQKRMETDLISQRDYYLLAIDIFKTLSLDRRIRPLPAKDFLEKSYNNYTKLIESSSILLRVKGDELIVINLSNKDEEIVITPNPNGFWNNPINTSTAEIE